ncbi:hypothetical protein HC761_02065 [bacterium]|nr:hypothetical protein [bacterium]
MSPQREALQASYGLAFLLQHAPPNTPLAEVQTLVKVVADKVLEATEDLL